MWAAHLEMADRADQAAFMSGNVEPQGLRERLYAALPVDLDVPDDDGAELASVTDMAAFIAAANANMGGAARNGG